MLPTGRYDDSMLPTGRYDNSMLPTGRYNNSMLPTGRYNNSMLPTGRIQYDDNQHALSSIAQSTPYLHRGRKSGGLPTVPCKLEQSLNLPECSCIKL
jgi:hypothetical protein